MSGRVTGCDDTCNPRVLDCMCYCVSYATSLIFYSAGMPYVLNRKSLSSGEPPIILDPNGYGSPGTNFHPKTLFPASSRRMTSAVFTGITIPPPNSNRSQPSKPEATCMTLDAKILLLLSRIFIVIESSPRSGLAVSILTSTAVRTGYSVTKDCPAWLIGLR